MFTSAGASRPVRGKSRRPPDGPDAVDGGSRKGLASSPARPTKVCVVSRFIPFSSFLCLHRRLSSFFSCHLSFLPRPRQALARRQNRPKSSAQSREHPVRARLGQQAAARMLAKAKAAAADATSKAKDVASKAAASETVQKAKSSAAGLVGSVRSRAEAIPPEERKLYSDVATTVLTLASACGSKGAGRSSSPARIACEPHRSSAPALGAGIVAWDAGHATGLLPGMRGTPPHTPVVHVHVPCLSTSGPQARAPRPAPLQRGPGRARNTVSVTVCSHSMCLQAGRRHGGCGDRRQDVVGPRRFALFGTRGRQRRRCCGRPEDQSGGGSGRRCLARF